MIEFLFLINQWIIFWLLMAGCAIGAYESLSDKDYLWTAVQFWTAGTLFVTLWRGLP